MKNFSFFIVFFLLSKTKYRYETKDFFCYYLEKISFFVFFFSKKIQKKLSKKSFNLTKLRKNKKKKT